MITAHEFGHAQILTIDRLVQADLHVGGMVLIFFRRVC